MSNTEAKKVLAAVEEVHVSSLPWSFRHCNTLDALEDARHLVKFMEDVTYLVWDHISYEKSPEPVFDESGLQGILLIQKIILDKLDIATGHYKFPFLTHDDDAPHLAERNEEE